MEPTHDVVLAGPLCAGKTTLAADLGSRGLHPVSAREAIEISVGATSLTREELQRHGAVLESARPGRWLAELAAAQRRPVVLDAARTYEQIEAARELLTGCLVVCLTADRDERQRRYRARGATADRCAEFADIAGSALEDAANGLAAHADLTLDSTRKTVAELGDAIMSRLSSASM